jgi:hypothetical protein
VKIPTKKQYKNTKDMVGHCDADNKKNEVFSYLFGFLKYLEK